MRRLILGLVAVLLLPLASAQVTTVTGVTATATVTTSNVVGTTTNNSAPAGNLGEIITATVVAGSAVNLTTATAANVTSISLTAGDWDVEGMVDFVIAATTNINHIHGGVSDTSATLLAQTGSANVGTDPNFNRFYFNFAPGAFTETVSTPIVRVSLASTTTIFLVTSATFTVSTLTAYGSIRARRVR